MSESHFVDQLVNIVGAENVFTEAADIEAYSHDEYASEALNRAPRAVVKPTAEEQVAPIVRLCSAEGIPITARGGGTGLSAGCVPSEGAVVLSFERLNSILELDKRNHTITAQAGVTMSQLFEAVKEADLFFPPHPGDESAFVGGIVATNAGGARAVKYGTVKRFITGLQVVMADGEMLKLGGKLIKSSTGYNLMGLMLGSEGTLGLITRVTFALLPPPACIQTLVSPFNSVGEATQAVEEILNAGIVPTAVEYLEHSVLRCSEQLLKKTWPAKDGTVSLMFILDGSTEDEVMAVAETIAEKLENNGALDVLLAEHEDKQAEILEIRSMLYEALRPGSVELFDISVPRSEIPAHVQRIHELEAEHKVPLPTYGHAADGNIHTQSMRVYIEDGQLTDEIPDWQEIHEKVRTEIYADAIKRGGVISGEHGVGLVKKEYLADNVGENSVAAMRAVKRALDPKGILNPGKVFDM